MTAALASSGWSFISQTIRSPFSSKVANVGTQRRPRYRDDRSVAAPRRCSGVCRSTIGTEAVAVGKTVVTMGYPSGPDRLLAMVDDDEAKSINQRFGNSRQNLINFLAQSKKIVPLTTQGAITDLDSHRIVHDAKTAEGGSGAPLFGQSGKVIGVNFGVFTENTAANMAVPSQIRDRSARKVRLEIARTNAARSK